MTEYSKSTSSGKILFVLLATLFLNVFCGRNNPENENLQITFETVTERIFRPACYRCHGRQPYAGGFNITEYGNIVETQSSQQPEYMIVNPGNPDTSYLYMKITGAENIQGLRMPPSTELPSEDIDYIRKWIEEGAPHNLQVVDN